MVMPFKSKLYSAVPLVLVRPYSKVLYALRYVLLLTTFPTTFIRVVEGRDQNACFVLQSTFSGIHRHSLRSITSLAENHYCAVTCKWRWGILSSQGSHPTNKNLALPYQQWESSRAVKVKSYLHLMHSIYKTLLVKTWYISKPGSRNP